MKIKNNFNYHNIFKSYIFIIIIQLLLSFIQGQIDEHCEINADKTKCVRKVDSEENYNCDNTKPHLIDNSCYYCGENAVNIVFYTIFSNGTCEDRTSEGCRNKIIYDSNECVGHCPNDYCELGDFCYSETSSDIKAIENLDGNPFKSCQCIDNTNNIYNLTFVTGNKRKYICVSECNYYNSDKNECVDNCTKDEKIKYQYDDNWNIIKRRCSSKCDLTEFLYSKNNSCLDNCPDKTFEKSNTDFSKECVEKCDIYKIESETDSPTKVSCISECNNNEIIVFDKIDSINNDPIKYCNSSVYIINYYYYNGIYFKICSDTKKLFTNINTYQYEKLGNDGTSIETRLCVEDCSNFDSNMFFDGEKCVPNCDDYNYYYKKECLDRCDTTDNIHNYRINFYIDTEAMTDSTTNPKITINTNDYPNPKECLEKCPTGTFVDEEDHQCYVLKCKNKYIKSNLECGTCGINEGYIVKEHFILGLSSNSEISDPTPSLYDFTREYCLSSCPKSSPYYNNGQNECFETNCAERGKVSAFDDPYKCYQSCQEIIGYNNEKDKICYKETIVCDKDFFYKIDGIKQCASETDCINQNFKYIQEKECRNSCNDNYYKIEPKLNNYENIEKLGSCFSDPKDCINQKYSFFNSVEKICREDCNSYRTYPEIVQNEKNETCFDSCPSNFPYKDQIYINQKIQKVCLKKCDEGKFFYGNECLENCNVKNKKYFENTNECVDECKKGNTYYYKIDEFNSNTCFFSCPSTYPFVTNALTQQNEPYICKKKCDPKAPYYYDDLKVCRKDCDVLYSSNSNSPQCVYQCEPGEKVMYNKNCTKNCPDTIPFISKEKLSNTNEMMVEKCVVDCPSNSPLKSNKTNYCLTECPLDENYKYNGKCFEKCPDNTYVDEISKECFKDKCPQGFKYFEKENGPNICKTSCSSGQFYLKEGGECMDNCPYGYNYTGFDSICLKECSSEYGEYFEKYSDNQYRYKCLKFCDKLIVNDTNECVSICPDDYYESPNNICYKSCNLDKDNPFSTKNDSNIKICSKKCHDSEPNYGDDYICKDGCSTIIDYDNKCVSSCTNPYYKYQENGKCVNKCSKYVDKNNKCVDECGGEYNYIEDNKCTKSCSEHLFAQEDDTIENMFHCVTKCDTNKYYYEEGTIFTKRKCYEECPDFVIQETHICYVKCPSNYYSYRYDKNEDSTVSTELTYKRNTCVIKCPKDKPYIYSNECYSVCPNLKKYHIENEFECISICPDGSKIEDNVCKSQCSDPDKKFINNKNECIGSCPDQYKYYVEGIFKCLDKCDKNNYHIEGDKCVTTCSNEKPYLDITTNECVSECDGPNNFVVKAFNHEEKDTQQKCLEQCPENYTYFEVINEMFFCLDKCDYKLENENECMKSCNDTYNFYDSETGICWEECPNNKPYYVEDSTLNYSKCYENCPNGYFSYETYNCSQTCDSNLLNFTNKVCLLNCELGKQYYDSTYNYCLNDCDELGLFEYGNQCVNSCSSIHDYNEGKLVANMATKKCECMNLYYIDNDNKINCIENCEEEHKYRLFGTTECLDFCNESYILSLDEKICFGSDNYCPKNTKNTTYIDNGIAFFKCDCLYKYYINEDNITICLDENEECPDEYKYLIEGTSQCIQNCSEDYTEVGDFCLSSSNAENKYWYFNKSENKYLSVGSCEEIDYFLIENTSQCIENCTVNNYFVYPNVNGINQCQLNCDDIPNTIVKRVNSEKSHYECKCTDLWYMSGNIIMCKTNTANNCKEAFGDNYKYLIKETKQCVSECPGDYPYLFDNECFNSCDNVSRYYDFEVKKINENLCDCKNLWKSVNGVKKCINSDICYENGYNILVSDTKECVDKCPQNEGYKIFNNVCYLQCNGNLEEDNDSCKCKGKWYQYNDNSVNISNIKVCLSDEDECPKDFYPYLDTYNNQCVEDKSNCEYKIIFNLTCYQNCPNKTQKIGDSCECDKKEGKWYQYIYEGKQLYKCGLDECPKDKNIFDNDTQECVYSCDENKYHFEGGCYSTCPINTKLVDELSKECVEIHPFEGSKDLKSLEEKIKTDITKIYEKTSSSNGVIYNINNSTMQIYGVNKNKEDKKDTIMRNNLTYIDLSYCLDKLYQKNGLSEDTDIIIVKYDIGEKTNSSTINPVEFKAINSKTGEEIPLSDCDDNSIIISYPLMNILNSFVTESNTLRNLEENENKKNLNLREKFLKGKELNIDDKEIDTFDLSNKLYTDICYPFKMNGKDLILEDRLNYLYPYCSFCESNCIYNKTDFISERVYCNCNPKDQINFERNLELMKSDPDMEKIKKAQKASILKCLGKISEISKNFGFFYGLIIILAEIAMCILTFLYSYKVFVMRINKKFDLKDDNINNINTENLESVNLSGREKNYDKNKNEAIIKTSERNLEYPPKKKKQINIIETKEDKKEKRKYTYTKPTNKREEIIGNADIINIKKTEKDRINQKNKEDRISSNSYNLYLEKSSAGTFKDSDDDSIFDLIKLESTLLTVDYQKALQKNKAEILIMILTEILDKIYLIKAIFFLHKYAIISLYVSLYLLWHMLIISFLSLFYNYSNLHKIWINDDYPNLNFHLSFGFLSCIISFIFYKGLSFLIFNDKKIAELDSIPKENRNEINEKYNKMMFWAKIKIIIFYAVVFILCIIFFLYLIAFCGVYIGARAKLAESYGIALIEVVIIKILYGIVLGILRKVSLSYEIEKLYFIVRILDLYIS